MDLGSPAGTGFMSTQRRDDGFSQATGFRRREIRDRRQRLSTDQGNGLSRLWLVLFAWIARVIAAAGTAPLSEIRRSLESRTATDSLHSDYQTRQIAGPYSRRAFRDALPLLGMRCASAGAPATRRSLLRLILAPSVLVTDHPSSPQNPAGQCRWTERQDGKRDMHFFNAA
jgi:hypothetical protein